MKRHLITKFHGQLERFIHRDSAPKTDRQSGSDYWLASDLQRVFGYARWANFARVIHKAELACKDAGYDPDHYFLEIPKLAAPKTKHRSVAEENGAAPDRVADALTHEADDFALTRYAAYLVAQAADGTKPAVQFARAYFLELSRNEELVERRIADFERLQLRDDLTRSEKTLAGLIYEHVEDEQGLSRIHIKGDRALFGGITTRQLKHRLQVPKGRALADFLPAIVIKAKDFAAELTNTAVKRDYLHTEAQITREHVKNNREVRKFLSRRKIVPEKQLAAEDIKKTERRFAADERKIADEVPPLALSLSAPKSQLALALDMPTDGSAHAAV
jgi:DNA-damage-inducible protein D